MDLSGYTKECGEYSITYSLATPWIQGRAAATVTRKVSILLQTRARARKSSYQLEAEPTELPFTQPSVS